MKHENRYAVAQESENTGKSSVTAPQAGAGKFQGFQPQFTGTDKLCKFSRLIDE